ncbi:MAG TPA: V-type ATP synthase subunit F [Xanthobacteraceae bacterium]
MRHAVFIGDELSAAGYRLTGIETQVPVAEAAAETLRASKDAALVIMTAELARRVPAREIEAALTAEARAFAIVPDVRMGAPLPDLAKRLRRTLGIEE